jgi:hypothetical protein
MDLAGAAVGLEDRPLGGVSRGCSLFAVDDREE